MTGSTTNIERIIAKIDNDFNPDNSDWIPRVAPWVIDVLQQLKVLRTKPKKRSLVVVDRIAYVPCPINTDHFVITDSNGCQIDKAKVSGCMDCNSSTGERVRSVAMTPDTIDIIHNPNAANAPDYMRVDHVQSKDYSSRYNVKEYAYASNSKKRNYVLVDSNKIEINFDADCIYLEQNEVETSFSEYYNCELPTIPNNGLLIEAIVLWCMYKMLTRGYKHPVFNLAASQYGTNPYYMYNQLKDQVNRSVIIDKQGDVIDDKGAWRSAFIDFTFHPKG